MENIHDGPNDQRPQGSRAFLPWICLKHEVGPHDAKPGKLNQRQSIFVLISCIGQTSQLTSPSFSDSRLLFHSVRRSFHVPPRLTTRLLINTIPLLRQRNSNIRQGMRVLEVATGVALASGAYVAVVAVPAGAKSPTAIERPIVHPRDGFEHPTSTSYTTVTLLPSVPSPSDSTTTTTTTSSSTVATSTRTALPSSPNDSSRGPKAPVTFPTTIIHPKYCPSIGWCTMTGYQGPGTCSVSFPTGYIECAVTTANAVGADMLSLYSKSIERQSTSSSTIDSATTITHTVVKYTQVTVYALASATQGSIPTKRTAPSEGDKDSGCSICVSTKHPWHLHLLTLHAGQE